MLNIQVQRRDKNLSRREVNGFREVITVALRLQLILRDDFGATIPVMIDPHDFHTPWVEQAYLIVAFLMDGEVEKFQLQVFQHVRIVAFQITIHLRPLRQNAQIGHDILQGAFRGLRLQSHSTDFAGLDNGPLTSRGRVLDIPEDTHKHRSQRQEERKKSLYIHHNGTYPRHCARSRRRTLPLAVRGKASMKMISRGHL